MRALAPACALIAVLAAPGRAPAQSHTHLPLESRLPVRAPGGGPLVLHSDHPLIDVDAVVGLAADDGSEDDVLRASIGFQEPHGRGDARVGRLMLATGAVRPVHVDGAIVTARAPSGSSVELFLGKPVAPEAAQSEFDLLGGARVAHWLSQERLGAGISYLHRRDAGQVASEEVGADLALRPVGWLSVSTVLAWDTVAAGLADARLSARAHGGDVAVETFAAHRVAAGLMPATSLFATLSDTATSDAGADLTWTALPRLDLGGTLVLESAPDTLGHRAAARVRLRLDDDGRGHVLSEANRRTHGDVTWTALRVASTLPLASALHAHASIELVSKHPAGAPRAIWPWTQLGASYTLGPRIRLTAAYEAKTSPDQRFAWNTLLRVSVAEQSQL